MTNYLPWFQNDVTLYKKMFTFLSLPCQKVQGTSVKGSAIIKQNTLITYLGFKVSSLCI